MVDGEDLSASIRSAPQSMRTPRSNRRFGLGDRLFAHGDGRLRGAILRLPLSIGPGLVRLLPGMLENRQSTTTGEWRNGTGEASGWVCLLTVCRRKETNSVEQNPEYLRAVGDVAKFLESRASQRFFEVIGNATGLLPLAIRKRAEAEAKALILLSEAEARGIVEKPKAEKDAAIIRAEEGVEVSVIKAEGGVDVRDIRTRAKIRAEVETVREQRNIESIAGMALLDMPSEVGDDSPNEDWIYSFFGYARGVSNPQMQFVWSKILSGEIRTPGSFSLLTLETMRTIQKREADLFTKACRCLFEINGGAYDHHEIQLLQARSGISGSGYFDSNVRSGLDSPRIIQSVVGGRILSKFLSRKRRD